MSADDGTGSSTSADDWYSGTRTVEEFARRIDHALEHPDTRIVWFLGAGCSVSSGIPGGGKLVRGWLPRLAEVKADERDEWEAFADGHYPDWREDAAQYYGQVIDALFETDAARQREVERLTSGHDPGYGYATLATLMADDEYGHKCNVAMTVNFDDLIADSLYLYTAQKPRVIAHQSLTRFIRPAQQRPLVVKIHGDARLEPKNTPEETEDLDDRMADVLRRLLGGTRLVVLGYAGADESVAELLDTERPESRPEIVYWVNNTAPESPLRRAFTKMEERVKWVQHRDFDAFFFQISRSLDLDRPDFDRLGSLEDTYEETLERLRPDSSTPTEGPEAEEVDAELEAHRAWALARRARSLREDEPEYAEQLYQRAIDVAPDQPSILGNYAIFLHHHGRNDRADEYYQRALELDPDHTGILGNYATFLYQIRGDDDRAEEYFERALKLDPNHPDNVGNYAGFLYLQDRLKEARTATDLARELLEPAANPQLRLELAFYEWCFDPSQSGEEVDRVRELIEAGGRSPFFDLSRHVEAAKSANHPNSELIELAAEVITEGRDASSFLEAIDARP